MVEGTSPIRLILTVIAFTSKNSLYLPIIENILNSASMNLFPLNMQFKKKKKSHLKSVATEGFFFLFLNQENKTRVQSILL